MVRTPPNGQLLVAGHVNVDHFLVVTEPPTEDRTVPVVAERVELGGTATNIARAARRRGVRVGLLARVGDGFPPEFRRALSRDGIDLRGLERVVGIPTPTCTIVEAADGSTWSFMQQGPMAAGAAAPLPGRWWRSYRWLHLGTGDVGRTVRIARAAHAAGRRIAFDPAQEIFYRWDRRSLGSVLPFADLLFGNRAELDRAAAWTAGGRVDRLADRVPLVVRTEGPDGASAFYRGGRLHVEGAAPRRVRTLVGAGDSFRGGFYGAWFSGEPLEACLVAGNRTARAWIEGRR